MNNSKDGHSLILLGSGGHAKSCINLIESIKNINIQGILVKDGDTGKDILGYPIIGSDDDLINLVSESTKALVTLGQIKTAKSRIKLYELIKSLNLCSHALVSPFASISKHVELGEGTVVMHGALINSSSKVGVNCILNSGCIIEHDVVIGNHCHISTGAKLNGGVIVEDECFIGSGANIKEGVTIGRGSIIGMGENIFHDCPPGSLISNLKNLK